LLPAAEIKSPAVRFRTFPARRRGITRIMTGPRLRPSNPETSGAGNATPALIVFSDLDGTLLDHETYSWQPAAPALDALKQRGIPLILASSKTAAEIAGLRAEMGFADCPAIVENGAGMLSRGGLPIAR
jgi:hypothetical protein